MEEDLRNKIFEDLDKCNNIADYTKIVDDNLDIIFRFR